MTSMNTPGVSVLMCCFNSSRWLQDAIDSVLEQTYEDFELILVNDGSSDETPEIIDANLRQDSRVLAVHKDHTGLTDSLNQGLAAAKSRWIARLDSDDLCEPNRLERQRSFAIANNVLLLGSGFHEIDEKNRRIKTHYYPYQHHRLVRHLERRRAFFPHSSAFFDRHAALDAGGYNPRFVKSQDRDLWARLAGVGRLACLQEPLVHVRKHGGSVSNAEAGHSQFVYGALASACFLLREAGVPDPAAGDEEETWMRFLEWASEHPETIAGQARFQTWNSSRSIYFAGHNRLSGLTAFAVSLLKSGTALRLISEKLFGSSLPATLANDWRKRSCAAS